MFMPMIPNMSHFQGVVSMSNEIIETTLFCLGCGKRIVKRIENETKRLLLCPCCNLTFAFNPDAKESWRHITDDIYILLKILDEDTLAISWDSGNDSNSYIFNVSGNGDITNYEAIVKELIDTVTIPSLIEEIQVFFDGCQKVGRYGNN